MGVPEINVPNMDSLTGNVFTLVNERRACQVITISEVARLIEINTLRLRATHEIPDELAKDFKGYVMSDIVELTQQ